MAPRALTLEEENARLRQRLAASNNQLRKDLSCYPGLALMLTRNSEVAEAALAASKANAGQKKLIAEPKGQAGKGSGYSLCTAMRLDRNKPRYNRLMVRSRYLILLTSTLTRRNEAYHTLLYKSVSQNRKNNQ